MKRKPTTFDERPHLALDALAKLTRQYASRPDFKELIHTLLLTLSGQFAAPSAFAQFKSPTVDEEERIYIGTGKYTSDRMLKSLIFSNECQGYFCQNTAPLVIFDSEMTEDCSSHHHILKEAGVQLVCPVLNEDKLLGLIGLGARAIRKPYAQDDVELIDILIRTISPLIASTYHHYEINRITEQHIDILNNVKQAVFLFDQDYNLKSHNRIARNLVVSSTDHNYSDKLEPHRHISDVFPSHRCPGWSSRFLKTAVENPGSTVKRLSLLEAGEEKHYEAYVTTIKSNSSIDYDVLVTIEDVTERVRAEEQLRITQFSVEQSADATFWIDSKAKFIYVNKAACKSLGFTREELLSMTVHDIDPNFPKHMWQQHWDECASQKSRTIESLHRTKDNRVFPVEVAINHYDCEGQQFHSAYARDITDRKEAEEALRESLQKSADIVTSMPSGLFIYEYEPEDRLILIESNPEATRLTGISAHEWGGREFDDIWTDPEAAKIKEEFLNTLRTGETYHGDNIVYSDEQLTGIYRIRSFKMSRQRLGVAFEDITAAVNSEQERHKLQEQLVKAHRMESLAILAGGVAHDLNNMLGPLVGYPELILLKLPEDSPIRKQVQRIGNAAQEAADVVQDLLTLARRGRYEMEPTNFNEIISSYLDSPGLEKLTEKRSEIELTVKLDDSLPDIIGSRSHLMKGIMNLCVNAFDATPGEGLVTITSGTEYLTALNSGQDEVIPGDYAYFSVKDTGKGIEPDDLPRIFEPYFSKKKMGTSGSGLGLAVVYGIVKDHSGYYDILTEPGKGTEFRIYIPVTKTKADKKTESGQHIGGTESILIVDDVDDQRETAGDLISNLGYSVQLAASGEEALELVRDSKFDLVVLDMIMEGGMDGYDTYRSLVKLHPGQKAIIVSGYSATERVELAQQLGAGAYVKKPFKLDTIGQAIRRELDREPRSEVPSPA